MKKNGVLLTMKELSLLAEGDEKTVSKRLRKLIEEERGVAAKVDDFINSVYNSILPKLREIANSKKFSIKADFNGRNLNITFIVFNCKTKKEEEELLKNEESASNAYSLYRDNGEFFRSIISP